MNSAGPKQFLVEKLSQRYEVKRLRGTRVLAVNAVSTLYLRFSRNSAKGAEPTAKFWFGVTESEYKRYLDRNLYVVCICAVTPTTTDYVVLPAEVFDQIKQDIPLRSGQWKFNLLKEPDGAYVLHTTGGGKYDVSEFVNHFDFVPREARGAAPPRLKVYQRAGPGTKEPPADSRPMSLEQELLSTSTDSDNPKAFEFALESFFRELGFGCRRIGGAGETDVLVETPVRFIVDGKSTRTGAKTSINFTRIKRHMKQNSGLFMVIASVGFDPAVIRDAELEGATLVTVDTLAALLATHRRYVLPPERYAALLNQPGLLTEAVVERVNAQGEQDISQATRMLLVIDALDFSPRSLDEIRGRLDLQCEQSGVTKFSRKELSAALSFLSSDLLEIVRSDPAGFRSLYLPKTAHEKLRTVFRTICQ